MNLQLNSPYKPCPYECPYCVAGFADEMSLFADDEARALYFTGREDYLQRLRSVLKEGHYGTVVITGSTEPTLFYDWIDDVVDLMTREFYARIEITTRNSAYFGDPRMQVVSYSLDRIPRVILQSRAQTTRAVFILHDRLRIEDIIGYHLRSEGQTTVKRLALNSYGNPEIDNWIAAHRVDLNEGMIARLEEVGIRYDHDCNNSAGRYRVFRADGNLYESWQSLEPMEEAT